MSANHAGTAIQVHWEFGDYADSYRAAARDLRRFATATPDVMHDVALPTLFLYRHALELALKDAYVWTETLLPDDTKAARTKSFDSVREAVHHHHLGHLLDLLTDRFEQLDTPYEASKPSGTRELVGPAVSALDELDVDGQRLRYPYLSRGRGRSWTSGSIELTPSTINEISQQAEVALGQLLDVLGAWFSEVQDEAIVDAWINQLWRAETASRLTADIQQGFIGFPTASHEEFVDDIKSEQSAGLVLFADD